MSPVHRECLGHHPSLVGSSEIAELCEREPNHNRGHDPPKLMEVLVSESFQNIAR